MKTCACGRSWNKGKCPFCEPIAAPTKRPYAQPNAQRRSIYTDDETWAKLKDLGKGNASAGIRISALHHGRLVEALRDMCAIEFENKWSDVQEGQQYAKYKARALLSEIEVAK